MPSQKFPGWWAVLPVAGACLLIAGKDAVVNRLLLSSRPAIFIGLISYPLYLWHWPLFSLETILNRSFVADPAVQRFLLVVASLLAAVATYYLIERPIRFGNRRRLKVAGLCLFGLLIAYVRVQHLFPRGPVVQEWLGVPLPGAGPAIDHIPLDDDKYFRSGKCHLRVHQGAERFCRGLRADRQGTRKSRSALG